MPADIDLNDWLRCSRYFIEGEDAGRAGGTYLKCPYFRGAIAFSEWMAGFREGCAAHFDLTEEMIAKPAYAPTSGSS